MTMNMKRLRRLHQHIYDRVDLKKALRGCADEPEKAASLIAQIESKTHEISTLLSFINSVDSLLSRYALLAHCLWEIDWKDIAIMDGCRNAPEAYRQAAMRGIKNNQHRRYGAKKPQCGMKGDSPIEGRKELDE